MATNKIYRVRIQSALRKLHLLSLVEKFRFYFKSWSLRKRNNAFIAQHPSFKLPPALLAFDAYSAPDWTFYKESGEATAAFLAGLAKEFFTIDQSFAMYEWGCGPARVIRHLPQQLGSAAKVFGSDYNPDTIAWCKASIPSVEFSLNQLNPPLPYAPGSFNFIYSISVFTHLGENTGFQWADELYRVLKPGGILLITTSGDSTYTDELLPDERKKYDEEGIVVRGSYEEGKKMFLARHNPWYVKQRLLKQFEIIRHVPAGGFPYVQQDYWLARKKG